MRVNEWMDYGENSDIKVEILTFKKNQNEKKNYLYEMKSWNYDIQWNYDRPIKRVKFLILKNKNECYGVKYKNLKLWLWRVEIMG